MNNKFKGLYEDGTSFITDRTEPINYYEPTIKTPKIQNHTYSINFDKTELYKEIETLQQELQRKNNNWNELKTYIQMNINATCNMNNDNYNEGRYNASCDILDKIKELESK